MRAEREARIVRLGALYFPLGGKPRRARRRKCRRVTLLLSLSGLTCGFVLHSAYADEMFYNPRTTYGEVGILDMPSARMAPDGEIALTISSLEGVQRYNASFQVLPWLEGSFRYSHIVKLFGDKDYYDRSFGLKMRLIEESRNWPDLSLGFRDILGTGIYSGEYLVASKHMGDFDASLGIGWGRFAESNALPNPFAEIFPSFKTRQSVNSLTGTVDFKELFHGPKIGVFGGVVWQSPIDNLDVLLEYSSDRYQTERRYNAFKVRSPLNAGLAYRVYDSITLSAGWYYGSSYGATIAFSANPTVPFAPLHLGPDLPQPNIRTASTQSEALRYLLARNAPAKHAKSANAPWVNISDADGDENELLSALLNEGVGVRDAEKSGHTLIVEARLTGSTGAQCDHYAVIAANFTVPVDSVAMMDANDPSGRVILCKIAHRLSADGSGAASLSADSLFGSPLVRQRIVSDIGKQSVRTEALTIDRGVIWLYFSNGKYASESEAAGRIARVLMADAPGDIEVFHIISVKNGLAMRDFRIARSALERAVSTKGTASEMGEAVDLQIPPLDNPVLDRAQSDTYPRFHWAISPGLRETFFDPNSPISLQFIAAVDGSVELTPNLTLESRLEANIWNDVNDKPSNSVLPHVRSDVNEYIVHGGNGIADLQLNYRNRIARDVYFEAKAGYLESMFAGAGGQVLWRPEGQRFAITLDAYEVWQRDFNRLFGLQRYHVFTGHASVYYESPWYGLNFNAHVGRYLAGDYGATFEISRRFSTGVEIGAFATFTNVPFSKFGEGSFDKGITIHVPFEWALPIFSQSSYDLLLRSLTRDGGQRLLQDDSLYEETRQTSYGEVERDVDSVVSP